MIVGPPLCRHCDRPIYPTPAGWVHQRGNPRCYSPAGTALTPEPRTPQRQETTQ